MEGRKGGREGGKEGERYHSMPTDSIKLVINLQHGCACVNRNGAGTVLRSTCAFPLSLASAATGSVEN